MLNTRQKGFTTVELLIATAVFSLVLLVAIFGFLQIGQIFYKGITVTRTQGVAEDIMESLASDVRFASNISQSAPTSTGPSVPNRYYFCAGNNRYTFILGNMVRLASSNETNNFGILRDDMNTGACANPFLPGGAPSTVPLSNPTELLGENMRVSEFLVRPVDTTPPQDLRLANMYNLNIRIVYGENSVLQNAPPADTNPANDDCNSNLRTSQYCHVVNLMTTVRRSF